MSKKIVAMLMAVAMAFSLLPVTAFAAGEPSEGNSQPVTNSKNNLTMNKTVIPKGDGTYTVRLESYATGSVIPTQAPVPMDIVLVLDVSGSMTDEIAYYTYQAINKTSWSVSDVYNAYYQKDILGNRHRTDVTYYAKIDDEYYPVSYQSKWGWGYREHWLEANNKPLGKKVTDSTWKEEVYNQELYTRQTDPNKTTKKLDAMKTAVNNFIESVAAQKNGDTPVAHRISIVKFAGTSTNKVGNDTDGDGENYTQKVTELTDVTANGSVDSLKDAVNDLTAGGATAADWGMQKAKDVLTKRGDNPNPSIVIMFTDGQPNHGSGYSKDVAGAAVDTAKTLKAAGTEVYTIGMFSEANPNDKNGNFNKYMNGVSSNYPNASGTKDRWGNYNDITLGVPADGNYYFKADNAGALDQVFQTISESTTTTSPLDASAVVVDNVPSNFALNEGSVKVYTANCIAKNGEKFTWGEATPAQEISSTPTKNQDGSQTISTTGFNFSGNWCGLDEKNQARGQKLIIEFTISRTNYGGTQPTNDGAYIKANAGSTDRIIWVDDPEVPVTIELNETLGVNEEKRYDGSGIPILSALSDKANDLVDGINNAYVKMELTVKVDDTTTYTYKIPAKAKTGSWYQGDQKMDPNDVSRVKTSQNVNRGENNAYTYKFDLMLSDAAPNGAADPAEYKNNTASFKITPKDVTVKAKDKSVVAGQPAPTYEADVTGTINSDTVRYTISCDYAPDATGTEFDITLNGETVQGNYNVTYVNGKLMVTPVPVQTGTLTIKKVVSGESLTLNDLPTGSKEFKITVSGNGESKELSLKDSGVKVNESKTEATWTISDLPAGEYTVSETNADVKGYDCTATYSVTNGATVTVNSDASAVQNQPATDAQTVTVAADSTSTMTVTNKYTKQQEVVPTPDTSKPDVNKTATALANDKTDVTLSVGGKSAKENVAVMFLLDKSTSQGVRDEAAKMLQHLKGLTNTNIIYDVVIFSGTASSTGWQNISNEAAYTDTQKNFANREPSSGTNMPVGIDKAIQDMETLNSQYSSYAENAYLITISDGITYLWDEDGTTKTVPVAEKQGGVDPKVSKTVDTWDIMYGPGVSFKDVYTDFANFLTSIPQKMEQTKESGYICDYTTSDLEKYIVVKDTDKFSKTGNPNQYACAPEFSAYYSTIKYQKLVKQFTKSFVLPMPELKDGADNTDNWDKFYPWGRELMLYLQSKSSNSGQGVVHDADAATIFAGIRNEILYEIKSGSITDVIGADFSLTDQTLTKDTFTLTVKGEKVAANEPSGNEITFGERDESTGKYPYVLTYYKGTATKNADNTYTITSGEKTYKYTPCDTTGEVNGSVSDEFFVLEMNVPVVSLDLKYNLSLTSKRTAAGTYEVPTNESATLAYTSANQNVGTVDFNEPTVSYTVKSSSGSHSGGSRPSLNTKDHYGYIIGYPVDYYTGQPTTDQTKKPVRPEGKITRAEVATIYFRMLTDESRTKFWSQSNAYSDVKAGDWFNNAVSTLSNAGIIAGYEDGSFKPNGYITRAEFATIAARFFDVTYNGKDLFPDISGHWAKDYINQAANKGFVNGYEDGTFKPDRNITRAEAVTLVYRTLDRHPDKNHFTKDMLVWPDNMDQTKWYYADMQEATNSHTYQMKENSDKTKYENWTKTLPIRNWEALEKAWSNANSSQGNGNVV